MPWTYQGKPIQTLPEDCEGFVYLITNTTSGKMYVGKKLAKFKKTRPPLKGRINKRRSKVESDWKEYWGSSDHLNADVTELGEDKFTREILYICKTRGVMSYLEEYYNGIINVRVGGSRILKEELKNYNKAI